MLTETQVNASLAGKEWNHSYSAAGPASYSIHKMCVYDIYIYIIYIVNTNIMYHIPVYIPQPDLTYIFKCAVMLSK